MSKKIYCIAQFKPKEGREEELFSALQSLEPNTLREDGCIQFVVTRQVESQIATGKSFPIVLNEIWTTNAAFEAHCMRKEIQGFFSEHCEAESGAVEDLNICIYSDEPKGYDAPDID